MKTHFKLHLFSSLIILINIISVASAQATAKEVNTQSQAWVSVNTTARLTNKFGLIADMHIRRNHFFADPGFYLVRFAGNYWINDI